MELFSTRK